MTLRAPFRFDIVGSFLRPDRLKEARARFARGEIAALDLKQVEDEEIAKLIEKQKAAGLHAITDGEFRRSYWHLDFFCVSRRREALLAAGSKPGRINPLERGYLTKRCAAGRPAHLENQRM